jgi:nitrate/nitrite transporter NarK
VAETQTTGHGRPVSWLAVVWIVAAFTVGGVALCTNPPTWWLFWAALGATSAGVAFAFAIDMMSDFTTEDM